MFKMFKVREEMVDFTIDFLYKIKTQDIVGNEDKIVDYIFAEFDEMLKSGEFKLVETILDNISVSIYSSDVLLSFVTICEPAALLLSKSFVRFQNRVNLELNKRKLNNLLTK